HPRVPGADRGSATEHRLSPNRQKQTHCQTPEHVNRAVMVRRMAHGLGTALKEKFSFNVGRRALAVCAPDPLRAPESRRLRKNFRGGSVIVYKGGDAGPWSLLGDPSGDRNQDPLIKSQAL